VYNSLGSDLPSCRRSENELIDRFCRLYAVRVLHWRSYPRPGERAFFVLRSLRESIKHQGRKRSQHRRDGGGVRVPYLLPDPGKFPRFPFAPSMSGLMAAFYTLLSTGKGEERKEETVNDRPFTFYTELKTEEYNKTYTWCPLSGRG